MVKPTIEKFIEALTATGGNLSQTAALLGVGRNEGFGEQSKLELKAEVNAECKPREIAPEDIAEYVKELEREYGLEPRKWVVNRLRTLLVSYRRFLMVRNLLSGAPSSLIGGIAPL